MRTARALTVSGGGGRVVVHPRRNFGEKEIGKKIEKKTLETPRKIGDTPSPKNWRHPPEKLETPHQKIRDPPGPDPPPVNRITHACENITLPELRCGR